MLVSDCKSFTVPIPTGQILASRSLLIGLGVGKVAELGLSQTSLVLHVLSDRAYWN